MTYSGFVTQDIYPGNVKSISIPLGLSYNMKPAFEYREPYFRDNFDKSFREWNETHTIDETWGLWGHNINKVIKPAPTMMAVVDGKVNEDQYCFSSPELENALIDFIVENGGSKFMIVPNDNDIACVCNRCKKLGNTHNNASPAVFTLLNKLAGRFPQKEFFSTAYITTQAPPPFKTAPNTGVMISTMAFPKGIVLEQSDKKEFVKQTFQGWKKVTNKIYLWDYAVNYDNYFDAYPTVFIAQQNLKFYNQLGVTGVFMHGSEENYSSFDDLKCYLYAQLLRHTDIDLKKCITNFFHAKYAESADLLASYYTNIEDKAFKSPKQLDIYGGINQSRKKYLDEEDVTEFYGKLDEIATMSTNTSKTLSPVLASLVFMKLELMRSSGMPAHNTSEVKRLTEKLDSYCNSAGITIFNESGMRVSNYIALWNDEIINRPYSNFLFGKPVKFKTTPDEDYDNPKMLADAAIGFHDYSTNWLISTVNILSVEINANDVRKAKAVELDFLSDIRHRIYLPEKVIVMVGNKKYEKFIPVQNNKTISKYRVIIPLEISPEDEIITIQAIKQDEYAKQSTACDEIFFK